MIKMAHKTRFGQYFATFACNMSTMMVAASFVWFTPILSELSSADSPVPMTVDQSSWIISIVELGEIIGPMIAGYLLNRCGRKLVLLTTVPMIAVSWVLLLSSRSLGAIYTVRILQGMAVGVVCTAAPVYVAEIAEPHIRGTLCGQFQTMWMLGLLWTYSTGPFLDYSNYIYVSTVLCVVFLISFVFLPETPYYLLMKGKDEEAKKSLHFFRSSEDNNEELINIKASVKAENEEGQWYDLFTTSHNRKMLLVVSSCCFVRYLSGGPALIEYLPSVVAYTSGNDSIDFNIITIVITIVALFAAIVSSAVADRLGRRPLVIISTVGCVLINLAAGVYYLLVDLKVEGALEYSWIAYSCMATYFVVSNIGFCTVMQTLQAECFSSKDRGNAGAFVGVLATICIFISLKQFQPFVDKVGMSMNFFSFALFSFVGSFAIFVYMKETAGQSLGEIQDNNRAESDSIYEGVTKENLRK